MKYIASWSGGKDSTASIILAHENNEPLDLIIFSEVMFDENISGELPEHIEFIHKCIPVFESWGYKVKILRSDRNYMDCFHHKTIRGKHKGMKNGFVMSGRCAVQRDCKLRPIKQFWKSISEEVTQYIGVAIDEQIRLDRVVKSDNQVSLLQKYGYTEKMAFEKCVEYDMLSPIYQYAPRGGCWFCPNARRAELRHLWENHRELFDKLVELEKNQNLIGNMWNTLTKTRISDIAENFEFDDAQITLDDYFGNKKAI